MIIGENITPADESEGSESNEIQSDSQNICIQPQSVSGNKLIRLLLTNAIVWLEIYIYFVYRKL